MSMRFSVPQIPTWSAQEYPEFPQAPFDLCFELRAFAWLLLTLGRRRPETGAMLLGPAERLGVDCVEFDFKGSNEASFARYAPNHEWCNRRLQHHLQQDEMRVYSGHGHTHPGKDGRPSPRVGPGEGDLGFAQAALEANEPCQYFLLPILTGSASGKVVIHPWVVERANPLRLLVAKVRVCPVEEFPLRPFNPAWEERISPKQTEEGVRHDA